MPHIPSVDLSYPIRELPRVFKSPGLSQNDVFATFQEVRDGLLDGTDQTLEDYLQNILTTLLHVGEPQCQVILHKRAWQARMNRFETEVNLCTYRKLVFQVSPQQ